MTRRNPRRHVLVVDDDEAARITVADALSGEGYEVTTAEDGERALRLLEQGQPPALLVLDLMMPGVTGWQILDTMERTVELAEVPVIVLTAFGSKSGLPPGCHVLHKPFERDVLVSVAKALV